MELNSNDGTVYYSLEEDKFFKSVNVPADGSCMFHSISYMMNGNFDLSYRLRRECCEIITANKSYFASYLLWSENQVIQYVNELSNPRIYAGHLELSLIIRKYRVSIWIYERLSPVIIKTILKEDCQNSQSLIRLLYVNGDHYMPLIETNFLETIVSESSGIMNEILNSLIAEETVTGSVNSSVINTVQSNDNDTQIEEMVTDLVNFNTGDTVRLNDDSRIESTGIENIIIDDSNYVDSNIESSGNNIDSNIMGINANMVHSKRVGRSKHNDNVRKHYLGNMKSSQCQYCGAYHFLAERAVTEKIFTKCCMKGKYIFEFNFRLPELIKKLLDNNDVDSAHFKENIRQYNASLAFASFGATISAGPLPGRGPYIFKIQGIPYHASANLQVDNNNERVYSQLYFIDSGLANSCRIDRNPNLLPSLLRKLDHLFRTENNYAKQFFNLREREEQEIQRCSITRDKPIEYSVWLLKRSGDDKNRYNLPTCSEVAAIFSSPDGCPPYLRDIEIHSRSGERIKLSITSQHTDPMTYPIFYPYGQGGWSPHLRGKFSNQKLTLLHYYSFLLSVREEYSAFLHGGKLTQQFIDDAYCKMEAERLNYYRYHQKNLRVEYYQGLHDYLRMRSEQENCQIGKSVILPSSFPGSPRNMAQNYQDAMAIVSKFGKPDLFITFTCNPKWPEITENLGPNETASDRPDLVTRVFFKKLNALIDELTKQHVLGRIVAFTYVLEWQKRGLPHCHILVILASEDKIRTPEDVNEVISAEIPDKITEPNLYSIVESNMIHGPCGDRNKYSPCMVDGKCTKNYPKSFNDITIFNSNGYPQYRRRNDGKNILIHRSNGTIIKVDNRDIIPYNKYLSIRFNAHINVEVCSTVKSVKYLFKYIHKGHSCVSMAVNLQEQSVLSHDEILDFLNARYVGPCEAFHRIYGYNLHENSHCIYRLAVHLKDMQSVYFEAGTEEQALMREAVRRTTLTEWFNLNQSDTDARKYLYHEMPEHYVWQKVKRVWTKRKQLNKPIIGRLYNVNIREGEKFYLRLLLLHKPGCMSFADVRTINGTVYDTYREAARAMNLLNDDSTWHDTMVEAVQYQMPYQLRELFALICIFCEPNDPPMLWGKFQDAMIEDYIHNGDSKELAIEKCLFDLNKWLSIHGKGNNDFGLPLPNMTIIDSRILQVNNQIDGYYDLASERENGLEKMNRSNPDQLYIIKSMMHVLYPDENEWILENNRSQHFLLNKHLFLINAAAGTGKTWVYNVLTHLIRSKGDIVVPLAFTGIAASLLMDGRTLHSALKLPLSLDETSTCGLRCTHEYAQEIKNAKLILMDEISMCPRLALNAINRFFRELMNEPRVPFGGKIILFGGDFMQTLPVVRHGSRVQIISNTVLFSQNWELLHKFYLHKNMRVHSDAIEYADWILKIGKGILSAEQNLVDDMIKIPPQCLVKCNELINAVFGSELLSIGNLPSYKDKAILTPLNEDTFLLNDKILNVLDSESKVYYSEDSIAKDEDSDNFTEVSSEFLHSITPNGMPCHKLTLKCGAIIILLRNLNTKKGLCNGTRLVVTGMLSRVIKAEILTGTKAGSVVFLPRIVLYSGKDELPFSLRRTQFPVRLAFSITINKAQGQSYEKTGIYLPQPVFSHGQLYVAFSRAKSFDDVIIAFDSFCKSTTKSSNSNSTCTQNIVFQEMIRQN